MAYSYFLIFRLQGPKRKLLRILPKPPDQTSTFFITTPQSVIMPETNVINDLNRLEFKEPLAAKLLTATLYFELFCYLSLFNIFHTEKNDELRKRRVAFPVLQCFHQGHQ